ncbi:MAG: hypothetical protein RJB38_1788 [Pseudomonadota bacterium]|jgi:Flp pilus assembly pilin Flp
MKELRLKKLRHWTRRLLKEESGQSIAEYVLILFIVVMIAMRLKSTLKGQMEKMLGKVGGEMDSFSSE